MYKNHKENDRFAFYKQVFKKVDEARSRRDKLNDEKNHRISSMYKDIGFILDVYKNNIKETSHSRNLIEEIKSTEKGTIEAVIKRNEAEYYIIYFSNGKIEILGDGKDDFYTKVKAYEAPQIPTIENWNKDDFEELLQYLIEDALVY